MLDASEAAMRDTIRAIPDGTYEFEDFLDDDGVSLICCPVDYSENLRLTDRLGELDESL